MLVAAGSNYPAQVELTKMMHELVGDFDLQAGKLVKRIIQDLWVGGQEFKPIDRLPPRLAAFYNAETEDFDGQLPDRNRLVFVTTNGLMIKMCKYDALAPKNK